MIHRPSFLHVVALLVPAFLAGCGSNRSSSSTTTTAPPSTPASTASVLRGADIGWSTQLATLGYVWEDQTQTQLPLLQILKNHGVNLIRIRTFVNPTISPGALGVGAMDQAGSIALAKAANAMGFQIMIDFHLSDTWADPGHQTTPAAWASDAYSQLQTDVYTYVSGFMQALAADGINPQYAQIGNEINSGMLWPIGSYQNPAQLAGLINAGYRAVKAVSPSTQVVIHLANLSDLADLEWFFDLAQSNGAQWDISGFSYYDGPGTLSTITANLNTMASRYGKPVMICEIGYTESDFMTTAGDVKTAMEAIASVPNNMGLGVIYWEPDAPDDATTGYYSMGAVSEPSAKLLQFNTAIDQFLFTGSTQGNQIINSQFSSGSNGWQITTSTPAAFYTQSGGNGTMLSFWSTAAYSGTIWQDVTGLPNGTYTLTAWVENGGGQTTAQMFAYPTGGSNASANLPTASSWTELQIVNVQVTEGTAWVGFTIDASAGQWTNIESVSFTQN
jgi:arabinogalactan endo-1,4-beta-galactosidase